MDQKQTSEHDLRLREFIDENGFLYKMLNDEYTKSYKDLVKTLLDEVLPFMPMFSKYYTDHGAYHSKEVVKMMDKLVEKITRPINSDEAFVLLASAWLHDIGMLNNTDPLTGSYLNDKEIRNRHGELSERVIENYKDKIFHHNIVNAKTLITSIKLVCRHHDQAKETFEDINDAAEEDIEEAGQIRKKLLISILRLADLLDLRKNRAPILPGEIFKIPTESSLHWKIYEIVNQYYIKNETEGHNTILEIIIKGEIEKDEEKIFK
ncbi:MAG: HD domain-containing protein, partial [Acidobacteria bacterium]|nr:HD domain-containing protein [Acidobacteriota bacterium]